MDGANTGGWKADPTGRHHFRYHNGADFTGYVSDNGVVGTEAPAERYRPTPSVARWGYPNSYFAPPPPRPRRTGLTVAVTVAVLEAAAIIGLCVAVVASPSTGAPATPVALPTSPPTTLITPTTSPASPSTTLAGPIGSKVPPSGSFSQNMGSVVYSSNFGANDGWSTGPIENDTTAAISKSQYLITGSTAFHHALTVPYGVAHNGMSVEVAATGYPQDNVSIGAGCQSAGSLSPALVYQLVVYPSGQWFIEEARLPGAVATLISGDAAPIGTTATVQLSCVMTTSSDVGATTQLVAYVNGTQVGSIGDQVDQAGVGGYVPMLILGTYGPQVTVAFTNIVVRSISPSP